MSYLHKRSNTSGSAPATSDIKSGEIAINLADGVLFTAATGGATIKQLGLKKYSNDTIEGILTSTEGFVSEKSFVAAQDIKVGAGNHSTGEPFALFTDVIKSITNSTVNNPVSIKVENSLAVEGNILTTGFIKSEGNVSIGKPSTQSDTNTKTLFTDYIDSMTTSAEVRIKTKLGVSDNVELDFDKHLLTNNISVKSDASILTADEKITVHNKMAFNSGIDVTTGASTFKGITATTGSFTSTLTATGNIAANGGLTVPTGKTFSAAVATFSGIVTADSGFKSTFGDSTTETLLSSNLVNKNYVDSKPTIRKGTTAPSNADGNDGDIYVQYTV